MPVAGEQGDLVPDLRHWSLSSKSLALLSAAICIALCLVCGKVFMDVRDDDRRAAAQAAQNLLAALETDILRNIELYDLSLQAVVENINQPELASVSPELRRLVLFDRAATARHLGAIRVLDQSGNLLIDSNDMTPKRANFSDHGYFAVHQQDRVLGLYMSGPTRDEAGHDVVYLSRKLRAADGSFAGVVVGSIRLDYFNELFKSIAVGPHGSISLLSKTGTVLANWPAQLNGVGTSMADEPIFKRIAQSASGSFEATPARDWRQREYHFVRLDDYPLILCVSQSTAEIYSGWNREAGITALLLIILCAVQGFLVRLFRREMQRRAVAETEAKTLAVTDSLTGLANRRHFDDVVRQEWTRAARDGRVLSLLMIDADHFKSFNDAFGHQAGDRLIATIGERIASSVRATDLAARYGGEEFAILLPNTSAADAHAVAERIRLSVAGAKIDQAMSTAGSGAATVSIGVGSMMPQFGRPEGDLIKAADFALYRAKRNGRNRTEGERPYRPISITDIANRSLVA